MREGLEALLRTSNLAHLSVGEGQRRGEGQARPSLPSARSGPKIKDLEGETAVKIKWPQDDDFDEKELCIWTVLKPADFKQQVHLGCGARGDRAAWRALRRRVRQPGAAAQSAGGGEDASDAPGRHPTAGPLKKSAYVTVACQRCALS